MNEMLGNQYFLARRYKDATNQFEKALLIDPLNTNVKKKLIICYLQANEISLALKLFGDLISEDISVILNSDPHKDDCPCLKMISELENFHPNLAEDDKDTALGILWLYCDILNSKKYFNKLLSSAPQNTDYQKINRLLNNAL